MAKLGAVPPDHDIEMWPADVIAGRDPQLEKAIELALEALEANPPKQPEQPEYPIRARQYAVPSPGHCAVFSAGDRRSRSCVPHARRDAGLFSPLAVRPRSTPPPGLFESRNAIPYPLEPK